MSEDKILERVRNLLARAEHPNTPEPEAELCFSQANKLMAKHAIAEAVIRSSQTESERKKPTRRKVTLGKDGVSEFWPMLRTIIASVADANRCRMVSYGGINEYEVFGFEEDVAWTEMLYTSIYFTFVSKVNPHWDESLGYDANIYNYKVAGRKWHDINRVAMDHGHPDMRRMTEEGRWDPERGWHNAMVPHKSLMKSGIVNAYKRHAKKLGDDNMVATTSFSEYRRQFAEAYAAQIGARLEKMAHEAAEEAEQTGNGAELALVDSKEAVNEFLYEAFPEMRPMTNEEREERLRQYREQRDRERRERQEMLDAMTDSQRHAFLEKEQREARKAARRNQRYWRTQERTMQSSAHERGKSVANSVDLTRKAGAAKGGDNRKQLG